jgi:SNF2 family DNA or RNA helicase
METRMTRFKSFLDRPKMDHKQYQYDGVRWILTNELKEEPLYNIRGGIIADEMGLGKTIMMIGTMLCNFVPHTLIIVPPVLIEQWYGQIYRTTGHKALIYHGANKKRITSINQLSKYPIVISSYGAITLSKSQLKSGELSLLHKMPWSRIIFDEAHHLRNATTTRFKSAKLLYSNIRWLITGTPVQNAKKDFYNLCSMIRIPAKVYAKNENLEAIIKSFILKRTKTQVGINISNVVQTNNMVKWTNNKEMKLSEEIHANLSFSGIKNSSKKIGGSLILLMRARQACIFPHLLSKSVNSLIKSGFLGGHDYLTYKEAFDHSSKLDYAVNKILERKGNDCGKLIFCHFREEIDEITARLVAGGMKNVATFDGRTSNSKRKKVLNAKNEALVLQIMTGCEGLNLQENYSEIYFISPNWNPAVENQAIGRCHRIGQTKTVYVERFEMCKFYEPSESVTADKYMGLVQRSKLEISNKIFIEN